MNEHFAGEDVQLLLVNVGEELDTAWTYVGETGVSAPCLLDSDQALYNGYDRADAGRSYAPFPLQVVVDGDGVIRYIATTYDATALRGAIEASLAD